MSRTPKPGRPVRGSRSGVPVMALLDLLGRRWGAEDDRWSDLAARLAEAFGRFSPASQQAAMRVLGSWLQRGENGPEPYW